MIMMVMVNTDTGYMKIRLGLDGASVEHNSPKSKSFMSFAACIPSSFKFFSICLLRARAARSSADIAHPIPENEKENP